MGNWTAAVTNAGCALLDEWLTGKVLTFTDARGAAGTVPEVAMTAQTDIGPVTQSADIVSVERVDGKVRVKLRFAAAQDAYNLKRIGLWAKAGDGEAVMLAIYQHTTSGIDVPSAGNALNFAYIFYAEFSTDNETVCSIAIEPTAEQAARDDAAAQANRAAAAALSAEEDRQQTGEDRVEVHADRGAVEAARTETLAAHGDVMNAQAAMHLRRYIRVGPSTDIESLLPGDELICTETEAIIHVTDWQDLLWEAQKAAANEANDLDTIAVHSTINCTNWRKNAQGHLWTTEDVGDFKTKITAFAAATVAAGYMDEETGKIIATWKQAQAWFINGVFMLPLDAERIDYPWMMDVPLTEYQDMKQELATIRAELMNTASRLTSLVEGGN